MAATVTISGLSASEPSGQRVLGPLSIQGSVVIGDTPVTALSQGDNTISIPAGSTGVIVIPPATGSVTLKYRTNLNAGDGGLPISPSAPFIHVFPSPIPTSIILNASSAQSTLASFWIW